MSRGGWGECGCSMHRSRSAWVSRERAHHGFHPRSKLQGGTADDLCHQLSERKIPFVIYSGYTNVEGECSKWDIVRKPADPRELVTRVLSVLVASALPNQC
jgi:hypothetical protein